MINRYVWDGCGSVMFYIENVEDKDHVVARAVVKRDKVNTLIDIVKDALASIGVDMKQTKSQDLRSMQMPGMIIYED